MLKKWTLALATFLSCLSFTQADNLCRMNKSASVLISETTLGYGTFELQVLPSLNNGEVTVIGLAYDGQAPTQADNG